MNESYIVAAKREARNRVNHDWVDRLRQIEGIEVVGTSPVRVQIRATPTAIHALRKTLGNDFHIEPMIPHERL